MSEDEDRRLESLDGYDVTYETSPAGAGRVRVTPSLTDEHIVQAVLMAKAVVALDLRAARAVADVAERDLRIEQMRQSARSAEEERRKLRDRLWAVRQLHGEDEQVSCGDGCCHEGLGVCRYCDEPYPCRTIQALDGIQPAPGGVPDRVEGETGQS